jgi:hypothetical protein
VVFPDMHHLLCSSVTPSRTLVHRCGCRACYRHRDGITGHRTGTLEDRNYKTLTHSGAYRRFLISTSRQLLFENTQSIIKPRAAVVQHWLRHEGWSAEAGCCGWVSRSVSVRITIITRLRIGSHIATITSDCNPANHHDTNALLSHHLPPPASRLGNVASYRLDSSTRWIKSAERVAVRSSRCMPIAA